MTSPEKAIAIIGSYRKEGIIDTAVNEIMSELEKQGIDVKTIFLMEQHIEFCTNCRSCLQAEGQERGRCVLEDDINDILDDIETADFLVIGSPVNIDNVTARTRQFMERCIGFGYWPWGAYMPKMRQDISRKAILVSSSAAPSWMGRYFSGAHGALKKLAWMLRAKPVGTLWVGMINTQDTKLPPKTVKKAHSLARKLMAA